MCFEELSTISMFFFGVSLSQKKISNPFWVVTVSSDEECQFPLDVKQNTHFTDENQRTIR